MPHGLFTLALSLPFQYLACFQFSSSHSSSSLRSVARYTYRSNALWMGFQRCCSQTPIVCISPDPNFTAVRRRLLYTFIISYNRQGHPNVSGRASEAFFITSVSTIPSRDIGQCTVVLLGRFKLTVHFTRRSAATSGGTVL